MECPSATSCKLVRSAAGVQIGQLREKLSNMLSNMLSNLLRSLSSGAGVQIGRAARAPE